MRSSLYCFLGLFISFLLMRCDSYRKALMIKFKPQELEYELGDEFSFIDLRAGDTVASIGAATGWYEIAYSAARDSLVFYLEDIDASVLNQKNVDRLLRFYRRKYNMPVDNVFHLQLGSENSTDLPNATFDKVLLRLSFHEFTDRQGMMQEISRILKPGGSFILGETLVDSSGKLDPNCGHPLFSEEALLKEMSSYGFKATAKSQPYYDPEDSLDIFTLIRFEKSDSLSK